MERLNKRIASSGVASRRKADELISLGKVKVNDKVIIELGYKVKDDDIIKVNDKIIYKEQNYTYIAFNKPSGYICSNNDELDRKTIYELLPIELKNKKLHSIGRLDYDTKGIILLTNDGNFTQVVNGPRSGVEKEYKVRIDGIITKDEIAKLSRGINFQNEQYLPSIIEIISIDKINNSTLLKVVITDGKNHEIKNMFLSINKKVKKLTRVRFGNITVESLPLGAYRNLTFHEIKVLINEAKKNKNLRER